MSVAQDRVAAASRSPILAGFDRLLPASLRVVGEQEAPGLDFVNLAATDLEDLGRLQVDRAEGHGYRIDSRHADNLDRSHIPAVTKHGQAENQPQFLIDNLQPARANAINVGQRMTVHAVVAAEGADLREGRSRFRT